MCPAFLVIFSLEKLLYRMTFYPSEIPKRFAFEKRRASHCFAPLILIVKNILQLFSSTLSGWKHYRKIYGSKSWNFKKFSIWYFFIKKVIIFSWCFKMWEFFSSYKKYFLEASCASLLSAAKALKLVTHLCIYFAWKVKKKQVHKIVSLYCRKCLLLWDYF